MKIWSFFPPTLELISPQNGFHTGVSSPEYQMGLYYEESRGGHSCKLHARAGWWGVPRMPKQVRGTAVPPRNTLEPALTKKKKRKNVHLSKWTNIQLSRGHNKCFWGPNCTGQRTGCWGFQNGHKATLSSSPVIRSQKWELTWSLSPSASSSWLGLLFLENSLPKGWS